MKKTLLTTMLAVVAVVMLVVMVACSGVDAETWASFGFTEALNVESVEGTLESAEVTEAGSIKYSWTEATEAGFDTVVTWLQAQGFSAIGDTTSEADKTEEYCMYSAIKQVAENPEAAQAEEQDADPADTEAILANLILAKVDVTVGEVAYTAGTMTLFVGEEDATDAPAYEAPHVHINETIPAVPATCTETGLTAGTKCSTCGEVLVAPTTVPALGHDYQEVAGSAVPATCTTQGKLADQKCSRCDATIAGAATPIYHNVDANGDCAVCEQHFDAKTSTTYYATLKDAINAAVNGETVTVLADVSTADFMYVSKKAIKIDLNGKDITLTKSYIMVYQGGSLELLGEGTIQTAATNTNAKAVISVRGTAPANVGESNNYLIVGEDVSIIANNANCYGIMIDDNISGHTNYAVDITINGTVTGNGTSGMYLHGNLPKTATEYPTITINDTASVNGIYAAGYGKWIINGGTIAGVDSAIEIRAGILEINGGTFVATNANFSATANANGSTITGSAIAISQHSSNKAITVTINGGTFTGAKAIYEVDTVEADAVKSENVTIIINGGTFTGAVESVNDKLTINGGTFTDLAGAVANAGGNAVIKLGADVSGLSDITIKDDLTLDLNNHSVTFNINCLFNVATGHFYVTGTGTISSSSDNYPVIQVVGQFDEQVEAYTRLTIDQNVTIVNTHTGGTGEFGINIADRNGSKECYNVRVDIAGTINAGTPFTISGNVKQSNNPIVNIASTARLNSTNNLNGMYLAGLGVTTIEEGAQVSGISAIEIRAGQLIINGGTFTATGSSLQTQWNDSGSTVKGSAIAVSQHTTNKAINVTINGGTFNGVNAIYENDLYPSDTTKSENVTITINDGTFTGAVESVNNKITDNRVA